MAAAQHNVFAQQAPIELAGEFISAVMRKDYHDAHVLVQALLMLEPNNETYIQFEAVLKEAKEIEDLAAQAYSSSDEDADEDDYEVTDSSDSGNDDHSSGDDDDDDLLSTSSSSEEESDSDDEVENNNNDVAGLNLLVGGLSIHNKY